MNMFKKTLASLLMMSALVSTSALANKDRDAGVRAAAETTLAKVEEAVSLVEKGAAKEDVLKVMADVRQAQKEFRYEQTERLRQKAGDKLKIARDQVESGDAQAAASLKAALELYKEMMVIYKAAH
jgi:large subunit ribosomal protein L7/L12